MNTPEIQRLLIKHGFIEELITSVDMITDKEVIQDLLANEIFKSSNSIIEGEILKIDKAVLTTTSNGTNIYCSSVTMKDKNSKLYEMKHQVILDIKALDEYIENLKPYYKSIVAVVTPRGDESLIRCYLKVYEDIDYSSTPTP